MNITSRFSPAVLEGTVTNVQGNTVWVRCQDGVQASVNAPMPETSFQPNHNVRIVFSEPERELYVANNRSTGMDVMSEDYQTDRGIAMMDPEKAKRSSIAAGLLSPFMHPVLFFSAVIPGVNALAGLVVIMALLGNHKDIEGWGKVLLSGLGAFGLALLPIILTKDPGGIVMIAFCWSPTIGMMTAGGVFAFYQSLTSATNFNKAEKLLRAG